MLKAGHGEAAPTNEEPESRDCQVLIYQHLLPNISGAFNSEESDEIELLLSSGFDQVQAAWFREALVQMPHILRTFDSRSFTFFHASSLCCRWHRAAWEHSFRD